MGDFKKIVILLIIIIVLIIYIISINFNNGNGGNINNGESKDKIKYINISAELMKNETENLNENEYVILDVRTKEEYDKEKIPNAVLLPVDEIESKVNNVLPNKDIKIYVYCRSGNRSKQAAYMLLDLGYNNVYDFGGIIDYPYNTIKGID